MVVRPSEHNKVKLFDNCPDRTSEHSSFPLLENSPRKSPMKRSKYAHGKNRWKFVSLSVVCRGVCNFEIGEEEERILSSLRLDD